MLNDVIKRLRTDTLGLKYVFCLLCLLLFEYTKNKLMISATRVDRLLSKLLLQIVIFEKLKTANVQIKVV